MGEKKTGNDDTVLKLVEIFVKEKKNLTKQFLKVEQCHWNSHLKKMSSSKKETKKEKLLREKLLPKLALIEVLKKCPKDARPQIISYLNSEGIKVLCETIHNVLRKKAPLKDSQKKRLRKEYKKDKKCYWKSRKKEEVLRTRENF